VIVFAAIAPHGGPVFDQPEAPTRRGMEELGRRFAAAQPESVIVLTPHGLHVDDHFSVVRSAMLAGDASQWTDADTRYTGPGDPALADECVRALQADGLPALGITFGGTASGSSTMPLDWGALIPLWFMRAPAVVVTPCRARRNDEHVRAGAALAKATGDRRIALIASADHGHGHTADGPYGFAAESAPYDNLMQELVRENRLGALAELDPAWAVAAKADSFWQLLMLHGALGDGFSGELLSYEAPTYFGMLTAAYHPVQEAEQGARSADHGAQEAGPQVVPEDPEQDQEARAEQAPRIAAAGTADTPSS
jgi:aromatic ring-opening dioxygenase LigB subunit